MDWNSGMDYGIDYDTWC